MFILNCYQENSLVRSLKSSGQKERLLTADRFLTRREAARMLGLAEGTLAVWCCTGKKGSPPEIPPNAALDFTVTLLSISK